MQNDGLGHRVSTQKTIIQTDHPSPRYEQKCDGLVCAKPNHHVFANISSYKAPFELSFFALKSCVLAGRFAYNEPYDFTNLIFTL